MKKPFFLLLALAALFLNACAPATTPVAAQANIEVSNAVILVDAGTMSGTDMSQSYAGYLQIKNGAAVDDQLVGVICDSADLMLHQTTMTGDVASMKEVSSIDVPAGGTVDFKTGGVHIMFMNLKRELKVGDKVNLTLKFKNAGVLTVSATVTAR